MWFVREGAVGAEGASGEEGRPVGQGLRLGLVLVKEARAMPHGFLVVMVHTWCLTPCVTFLRDSASPRVSVKVLTWAAMNVVVPVTTAVPEGR